MRWRRHVPQEPDRFDDLVVPPGFQLPALGNRDQPAVVDPNGISHLLGEFLRDHLHQGADVVFFRHDVETDMGGEACVVVEVVVAGVHEVEHELEDV